MRRRIGAGWVDELSVDGKCSRLLVEMMLVAAREAGRGFRVTGPLQSGDLPQVLPEERWVADGRPGEHGWRLARAQRHSWQRPLKRATDLVLGTLLLIVLSPVMLCVAVAVRLSSPGPVLYPWRVVGRFGRPFTGYKFRTMTVDADQRKSELLARNEMVGPVFKLTDDPRLTAVGRWLRRYSLDELPQLWSVVKGDMSLVGPRPSFRHEYQAFELWQMRKLTVTPGLSCLWQVSGRNRISDFAEWARLDLDYIDHWSWWLDARIIARTIAAVVRGTGR